MARRILIIDDEQDIRSLLALILKTAGYEVAEARGGKEGLALLNTGTFHLVILDIMMPEMDGWEVCSQLKSLPRRDAPPVLILTVRSQPLDRVIGMEVVLADDYLTKPFNRTTLLQTVERLIGVPAVEA